MRFISTFAGIGGLDLGLERAGMTGVAQVEINPQSLGVLRYHYPSVPKWKDIRDTQGSDLPSAQLLVGGFPCQDLSVAGHRRGLAGSRSGLFAEFARLAAELRPEWLLIENVPGLLQSNNGKDMGTVIGTLGQLGYSVGYRVFDAQHFGVPQRRRRVWIVGHLGGPQGPLEVLFETDSVSGDPQPRGETRQGYSIRTQIGAGIDGTANTLTAHHGHNDASTDTYVIEAKEAQIFQYNAGSASGMSVGNVSPTLKAGTPPAIIQGGRVRRITPVESERLQGFPDNWTLRHQHVSGRVDIVPDTNRYVMVGNSVPVPVVQWIGERMMAYGSQTTQ